MKKYFIGKIIAASLACTLALSSLVVYGNSVSAVPSTNAETTTASVATTKAPKYVFLFIGDGMSYPQIQSASDYLGALDQEEDSKILTGGKALSFMNFETAGSATTFDSTSFCPDSASTATSISTGHKTYSSVINMDETLTVSYETIAEKLKEQKDYKIGVITSVNLNHATPAAFYAHQPSRNNYYEIGQELIASDFDYFAGGELLNLNGKNGDQESLHTLAEKAGYDVITTQAEAEELTKADGKAIVIGETLADSDSLSYDGDRASGEWALADYVKKGIEVLDNDKGFFMMVEGGKIDWACHANDAGSSIGDTLALDEAVKEAVNFYNQHPDETLIIVTGDHETGGLTIGYAGTNYDTYLENLENQKISYAKFDSDYVSKYKEEGTSFEDVMKDVEELFGLKMSGDDNLTLTAYEIERLKAAYDKTMSGEEVDENNQAEYVMYGTYEPLSVTITHILNNKSGINFSSYSHTGLPVGVFATGAGAESFEGYYDNTDIYNKLASLTGVK